MNHPISDLIQAHKNGLPVGIYSICSANSFVLKAAMLQAKKDGTSLLIESTSNQVNQFGGYTRMTPGKFAAAVKEIAYSVHLPLEKLILGGDHLGPNPWQSENSDEAMKKASDLIEASISAGYTKIHLDTSMRCANDTRGAALDVGTVAERAALLCEASENVIQKDSARNINPVYVIGTDVPIPGGAQKELDDIHVTHVNEVEQTIELTKEAFLKRNLHEAWERVIGIVVQPGVEFGNDWVMNYSTLKSKQLSRFIENYDKLTYEAHSTDYQRKDDLRQMVRDHFAILKVGPWLTFAFREAVFALANIETEWLSRKRGTAVSNLIDVIEKTMRENPAYWENHYHGDKNELTFKFKYSYSDRIRYYWPFPEIKYSLNKLLTNLQYNPIPLTLLSQFLPTQYQAVQDGQIQISPEELIYHKINEVTGIYAEATQMANLEKPSQTVIEASIVERG
jgi:D-tagatose-1,6-bisphosphate aldolase subunit GatZ/KbaZ